MPGVMTADDESDLDEDAGSKSAKEKADPPHSNVIVPTGDDFSVSDDDVAEYDSDEEEKPKKKDKEEEEPSRSESIAAEGDDDEDDEGLKKEANRVKRNRRKMARDRDRAEIETLRAQIAELQGHVGNSNVNAANAEIVALDNTIEGLIHQHRAANERIKKAVEEGDGKAFEEAERVKNRSLSDLSKADARKIEVLKSIGLDKDGKPLPRRQQQQQRHERPPQAVIDNFNEWRGRNTWYDPNLKNTDSRVAYSIDIEIKEEGFDPADPEYWEELDERLAKYIPHRYPNVRKNGNGEGRTARKGPPVSSGGGSRSNGSSVQPEIKAARIRAMKEAGIWDDPKLRKDAIKRYNDYDREAARR